MKYESLLDLAKRGQISDLQAEAVAQALEMNAPGVDPYTLLHIPGRANARQYRDLVEGQLNARDPMMRRLASQI